MSAFIDALYTRLQSEGSTNITRNDLALVEDTANYFGVKPEWLANLIHFESGFSTSIQNKNTRATGLIQFMPSTAQSLNTSVDELKEMSFKQQMVYVKEYILRVFKQKGLVNNDGSIKKGEISQIDLFMMIFYPTAVGKPNFQFPQSVQNVNPGITTPKDYEALALKNAPFKTMLAIATVGKKHILAISLISVGAAAILGIGIYLIINHKTK